MISQADKYSIIIWKIYNSLDYKWNRRITVTDTYSTITNNWSMFNSFLYDDW